MVFSIISELFSPFCLQKSRAYIYAQTNCTDIPYKDKNILMKEFYYSKMYT